MAGTTIGGKKARDTNYERYGSAFYKHIGAKGGANGHTGGFVGRPDLARAAGAKGGRASHRGPEVTEAEWKKIEKAILRHPEKTRRDIAADLGVNLYRVAQARKRLEAKGEL